MVFVFGNNWKIYQDFAEFNNAKTLLILMSQVTLVVHNFLLKLIALLQEQLVLSKLIALHINLLQVVL